MSKTEHQIAQWKVELTRDDGEKILENKDVFKKFIEKTKFNYQLELSKGTYRGQEEKVYIAMDACDELIKWLDNIEKAFKEFRDKQEKEEEERKKKEDEKNKQS